MSHRDRFEMEQELEIFLVQFTWDADRAVTDRYGNGWLRRQSAEDRRLLRNFFDLLRLETASDALSMALAESVLLSTLLVLYRAAIPQEPIPGNAELSTKQQHLQLILRAKKYIHRHYREPIRLADAALYLQVSSFHLSRIFSRESDFSFFDYLLEVRLNEAKQLLQSGRHRVGEVALRVGYDDAGYFSRLFKARTGCTPKEYAERARLSTI
ncbi:HTH-type transcriptional activator RhaR [bioreactor metagenome]|uniref:HTH-type transcriptional activator RhaR n=1 Tax=bioreactor metagenome TaxID=1076179 RepID=A0A645GF13_9ZZZZ